MIVGLVGIAIAFSDAFGAEENMGMSDEITVQVNATSAESETNEETSEGNMTSTESEASGETSAQEEVSISDQVEIEESETTDDSMMEEDQIDTPRAQVEGGVSASDVICKSDLELVLKAKNGMPACVSPSTAMKLIERGWAVKIDTMMESE